MLPWGGRGRACLKDAMCTQCVHIVLYAFFFWPTFFSKKYQSPHGDKIDEISFPLKFLQVKVPNSDKQYLIYFDGRIPDYRLTGKLNRGKTFETPELSGLTRFDCRIHMLTQHIQYAKSKIQQAKNKSSKHSQKSSKRKSSKKFGFGKVKTLSEK